MSNSKKCIFLVLSTIDISDEPLSYTKIRSIYNTQDRLMQTKKTVNSIREKNDEHLIVFIEAGRTNYESEFIDKVDAYYYVYDKEFSSKLNSKHKAYGETSMLLKAQKFISKFEFDLLFKISGRYYLNKEFDDFQYLDSKYNFRLNTVISKKSLIPSRFIIRSYSTVLYAIPQKKMRDFFRKIKLINLISRTGVSLEYMMYLFFRNKKNNEISKLNVCGNVAVDGNFVEL